MPTTTFTAIALLVALLYAFQNLARYVKAKDWNGAVGILVAAASGVGAIALAANSDATAGLHLIDGGKALGNLDGGSLVLLGISVGSAGTVLADVKSAIDNKGSAVKPPIVGPSDGSDT